MPAPPPGYRDYGTDEQRARVNAWLTENTLATAPEKTGATPAGQSVHRWDEDRGGFVVTRSNKTNQENNR